MRDPALGSSTLRLANSAYFTGSQPVGSVSEAVFRLGFREVYKLAVGNLASRWFSAPIDVHGWYPGEACRRALIVASGAAFLASDTAMVDRDVAYTAGLMHELGRLAIAFCCADSYQEVMAARGRCGSIERAESEVLGFNYPIVGAKIMEEWKFPPDLVAAARFSGAPTEAPAKFRPIVMHVHGARSLTAVAGLCSGDSGWDFIPDTAMLDAHGFTAEHFEAIAPGFIEVTLRLLREQSGGHSGC